MKREKGNLNIEKIIKFEENKETTSVKEKEDKEGSFPGDETSLSSSIKEMEKS